MIGNLVIAYQVHIDILETIPIFMTLSFSIGSYLKVSPSFQKFFKLNLLGYCAFSICHAEELEIGTSLAGNTIQVSPVNNNQANLAISSPLTKKQNPSPDEVVLNFSGTELKTVLQVVHQQTGERFLFDESLLRGKSVTFYSGRPIHKSSLMSTLTSILEMQNLALVRVGVGSDAIFKIVSSDKASKKTTPTYNNQTIDLIPDSDEIVTLLYKLHNLIPSHLVEPFGKMASIPNAITAIEGSSLIKITDTASNLKRMVELIVVMDEAEFQTQSETIKIQNTIASRLVQEIQPMVDVENDKLVREIQTKMMTNQRSNNRNQNNEQKVPSNSPAKPIVVSAIDRLNSIVISGTPQQVKNMTLVIRSLDVPDERRGMVVFYDVHQRIASDIIPILQTIYNGSGPQKTSASRTSRRGSTGPSSPNSGSQEIVFQADDGRSKIMVIAPESMLPSIENMITQLDEPGQDGQTQVYPVLNADIHVVESQLKALFSFSDKKKGASPFQIVNDALHSSLIIRASDQQHLEIKEMLVKLDRVGEEKRIFKTYPLSFTDATEMLSIVRNIFGYKNIKAGSAQENGDIFNIDRNANAIVLFGSPQSHEQLIELLATLDAMSIDKLVTQYYTLTFARPDDVVKNIRELYPTPKNKKNVDAELSITIDAPSHTLIIKAERSKQEQIKETIAKLDIEGDEIRTMKTYPLLHADPTEAAKMLMEIVGIKQQKFNRNSDAVNDIISVDLGSSKLMVFGQLETHNKVVEALQSIDIPNSDRFQTIFYNIENADPQVLYSNLIQFFGINQKSGGSKDIYVTLNPSSRVVMVKALPDKQKEVAEAIKKLDINGTDPRQLIVYSLQFASAEEVSKKLQNLLALQSSAGKSGGRNIDPYPNIINADEGNSSIVLFALAELQLAAKETIEKLDIASAAEEQTVYYQVKHLPLMDAVYLLTEMFGLQSTAVPTAKKGKSSQEQLILDENSNTMIIIGTPKTHAKIKIFLDQVDVPGQGGNELKYYPIENTTALEAAKTIEQLFGLPTKSSSQFSRVGGTVPLQRNPMVIPNIESNTLIINAPHKTQLAIETMLSSLSDISKVDKMTVRFYPLENTNADDIAGKVAELFSLKLGKVKPHWWPMVKM
jgi:type II secretory pathway component GspD/PulD (secretin)